MSRYNWPTSMPYDTMTIHDQTEYIESTSAVDTTTIPSDPIAFIPFVSPRGYGKDEELVYLNSSSITKYGNPDFNKYGLSLYLAKQWIEGNGNVLGMRLKAPDATYAHVGIYADIKLTKDFEFKTEVDTNNKVIFKPYFKPVSGQGEVTTIADIQYVYPYIDEDDTEHELSLELLGEITDSEGNKTKVSDKYVVIENYGDVVGKFALATKNDSNIAVYEMIEKEVIQSTIGTKYYATTEVIGDLPIASSKDTLAKQFEKFVSSNGTKNINDAVVGESGKLTLDLDVTYTVPLWMWYSLASGPNDVFTTLEYDTTMETVAETLGHNNRFYKMTTYDGNTEIEPKVSFGLTDYVYSNQSMYIEDVAEDYLNNIGYIPVSLEKMYEILNIYVVKDNVSNQKDLNSIDFLFGGDKDGYGYTNYVINTEKSVDLRNRTNFGGGSLGSFASTDETKRETALANAFADAYNGVVTDMIFDEIRYPFSFVLQPCANTSVCKAIAGLCDARESTNAIMYVAPTNKNYSELYSEARSAKNDSYNDDVYNTSKLAWWVETAIIRDPYTHKRIRMPSVYFNAKAIPRLLTTHGYGTPLAGSKFYWDGFVINSLLPKSSNQQEYIENHKVYVNTMIEDGKGIANAVEQITSQHKTSQLSEISNSITLRKMCNIALNIAKNKRWSDLGDEDIGSYKTDVEKAIINVLGKAYSTLTVTAERETINGAGRNRVHCKITVSFKALLKGVTYDIYVI